MVIDSDPAQHALFGSIFEKMGFIGTYCNSGDIGLAQLISGDFDLVILDTNLPGKGGAYALKKIRENLKTREMPVVIFTSDRSREMLLQCTSLGISDYLIKPGNAELIMQKLRILHRIISISKEAAEKSSFANVAVDHLPGITRFTFTGQFSRYSVKQFQNLYTPLFKSQTQGDVIMLILSLVPTFGPLQAEPLSLISQILEPKQAIIVAGKNYGPLIPMIYDFQSRLFLNEADAMKAIKLRS